jgi:hypothetical protein
MNKKEKACDKDYITFYMKANNNFRAEFKNAIFKMADQRDAAAVLKKCQ